MDQQVHFTTVSTTDLDAVRAFYTDGLAWTPLIDVPDEIVFYQVGPGAVLGFFASAKFAADLGRSVEEPVSGLVLAHNVGSVAEVEQVAAAMVRAGGTVLTPPQAGEFGGIFHAHVEGPDGLVWEVAHNPGWHVQPDGTVTLG